MTKTLADLAETMRDIDFTLLTTVAADGGLAARPMSNNRDVDFDGDSFFFALGDTQVVADIARHPKVGMTLHGNSGLLGKPPVFIAVAGTAELIRDKAAFEQHWNKDLDRWFEQGTDTPGLTLIKVHAEHVHYCDGDEQGEVVA
ncbi:pyridoxamine 5'-phosphate oxidase family protein [Sphingomonas sp. RT2P30]|uniref:pyridoxamine 5'-phosphate oxidase family protein n=1 Tax=Parasphingomonas halimpatiens TaxID=3096162 RepID=UPI002FC95F6F